MSFPQLQKVCIFLNRTCNLKCRGCNVINHKSAYEMTTNEWCKAFDIMKSYGVGFIVLFGGEPTLRHDLPELIRYLNSINMPHTIITNSYKLTGTLTLHNILRANPYSISVSINHPRTDNPTNEFDDEIKTDYGWELLDYIQKFSKHFGFTGELVANMAVTKPNILQLPSMVETLTKMNVWSIMSFIHLCDPHESTYWWYRGPKNSDNENLLFKPEDKDLIHNTAQYFIDNYDRLKLHNGKEYFAEWERYGITQDWHCKQFTCPSINPDGTLMPCIDRTFTKPFNILTLAGHEAEMLKDFDYVTKQCSGCAWDHLIETGRYAELGMADKGKQHFAHKE